MMCPRQVAQLPLIEAGSTASVSATLTGGARRRIWQNIRMRPFCRAWLASLAAGAIFAATGPVAAAAADDGYRASIRTIDAATASTMIGVSWRPGCPVPLSELRRVRLTYWGFDGARHRGELI